MEPPEDRAISFSTQIEIVKRSAKEAVRILQGQIHPLGNSGKSISKDVIAEEFLTWYEINYDTPITLPGKIERSYSESFSDRFTDYSNAIKSISEDRMRILTLDFSNLRVLNQDSVEYTLDQFESDITQDLLDLEAAIIGDLELSEEEKISLVAASSLSTEIIPLLTEELSLFFESALSSGRTLGLIKWVAQKAKQIINGIATVVYAVVDVGLFLVQTLGWPLLASPLGITGLIGAAVLGGAIGAALGLDCVIDQNPVCYVCVLEVNVPNDPCYQY